MNCFEFPGKTSCEFNHLNDHKYDVCFNYFNSNDIYRTCRGIRTDLPKRCFTLTIDTILDNIPTQIITYNLLELFKTYKDIDRCVDWLSYVCFHMDYDGYSVMSQFVNYKSEDFSMQISFSANTASYLSKSPYNHIVELFNGIAIKMKNETDNIETEHTIFLDKVEAIKLLEYFKTISNKWKENIIQDEINDAIPEGSK